MAAGRSVVVASCFVGQIGNRVQAHLALLGDARQQTGAGQPHVVMRETLVAERLQCSLRQRRASVVQRLAQVGEQRVVGEGHGR